MTEKETGVVNEMIQVESKRYENLVKAECELSLLKNAITNLPYDPKVETIKNIFSIKSPWETEE